VDIAVAAMWLGHESIETTNVYVHPNLAMNAPFRRFRPDDRLLPFLESL
jgi:integrase/recombinase XerD